MAKSRAVNRKVTERPSKAPMRKVVRRKAVSGVKADCAFTKQGQHVPTGGGCIATSLAGRPCPRPRATMLVPYCRQCMRTGDPSLKAVKHPRFGKILVARRTLPKPYYVAWWGRLKSPRKLPDKHWEWALQTDKGIIDAVPHKGSQLQFTACPGPHEIANIDYAPDDTVLLKKATKDGMACSIFCTSKEIPKEHQLTMMYNSNEKTTNEFFAERGLVRADVGTATYPAMPKKTPLFSQHGQNFPVGDGCISTCLDGTPCPLGRASRSVPYCTRCMESGDPSLKVVQHPKYGKILVAMRDLPKPYYVAWWGDLMDKKQMPEGDPRWEWALIANEQTVIDATPYKGSQLQFTACPGPSELPNIDWAPNESALVRNANHGDRAGAIFRTFRDIPKHYQVTMMYNEDEKSTDTFFKERGLMRADVGTRQHPALRKLRAGAAPLR